MDLFAMQAIVTDGATVDTANGTHVEIIDSDLGSSAGVGTGEPKGGTKYSIYGATQMSAPLLRSLFDFPFYSVSFNGCALCAR